ncbi:MAG: beta-glucosidase [Kamptonema sp. SIO1D9]|nr:beta-glucosidase [Kamptonema sp. SIO1D9]
MKPLSELSLKEQIGQTIVVRASGHLFDRQRRYPMWEATTTQLKNWIENLHIGGVILLGASAAELSLRVQQLQGWAKNPLLIAADIEEGVGQRFEGATWFPPPMAIAQIAKNNLPLAEKYAREMGAITAQEALTVGINWILAPVVDVNNNPYNPVINVRAFGESPEVVSKLATAFIQGTQPYPILTAAKHFPGHGDTATDSHLALPVLPHSDSRLQAVELPPFAAAIAAGVDSVMTAHLLIPVWDAQYPATVSEAILTGKLRQQLGFDKLIVTDALIMGGIAQYTDPGELAVLAIAAGADIILMPPDPEVAIEAVYDAVQSGRISQERIELSLQRIAQAKSKVSHSPTSDFLSQLAQPVAEAAVEGILTESMRCNLPANVPSVTSSSHDKGRNLIFVPELLKSDFISLNAPAVTIPAQFGYELQLIELNNLLAADNDPRPTLLQIFWRGNPFRGTLELTSEATTFIKTLLNSGKLTGLLIYGSKYILDWYKELIPTDLPWIFSYGQMPAAQESSCQAIFGSPKSTDTDLQNFV